MNSNNVKEAIRFVAAKIRNTEIDTLRQELEKHSPGFVFNSLLYTMESKNEPVD